jgi:hypothetical protein
MKIQETILNSGGHIGIIEYRFLNIFHRVGIQWCNIHIKFYENLSICSKLIALRADTLFFIYIFTYIEHLQFYITKICRVSHSKF